MSVTFIDVVTLLEAPNDGSPFYVVESDKGKHYVSGLGGRAARGLKPGTKLKLYRSQSAQMTALHLERA